MFHNLTQTEQKSILSRILVKGREIESSLAIIENLNRNTFQHPPARPSVLSLDNIKEVDDSELFSPDCEDRTSKKALQLFRHLFKFQSRAVQKPIAIRNYNLTKNVQMQYEGKPLSYGGGIGKIFDSYLMEVFEYGKRNRIPFAREYGEQNFNNAITELLLTTFIRERRNPDRRDNLKMLKIPLKLLFPYFVSVYLRKKAVNPSHRNGVLNAKGLLENFRQFIGLTDEYLFKQVETDEEKMSKLEEEIKAAKKMEKGNKRRLKLAKLKQQKKGLEAKMGEKTAGETKNVRKPRFEMSSTAKVEINGNEIEIVMNDYDGMSYDEYIDYFTIFMLFDFIDNSDGHCVKFKDYNDEGKDVLFCPYGGWLKGETSKLNKFFNKDFLETFLPKNDVLCVDLLVNLYLFAYEDIEYSADEIINKIRLNINTGNIASSANKIDQGLDMIRSYLRRFLDFNFDGLSDKLKNKIQKRFKNSKYLKRKFLEMWIGSSALPDGNKPLQLNIIIRNIPVRNSGESDGSYASRLNASESEVHTCFKQYNLKLTPEQFNEFSGAENKMSGYETFIEEIMHSLLSEADLNIAGGGYQIRLRPRRRRRRRTIKRKRKKVSTKKKNKNKKIKTEKRRRRKRGTRKN